MLTRIYEGEFDKVFALMQESFPSDEYREKSEQFALFVEPEYSVYGIVNENYGLNAFIAVWNFSEFLFVEHFAVKSQLRGQGLGAKILQEVKEIFNKPLCLEVELPLTHNAERRIEFYKRNAFYYNDYDYTQPPMSKGKNALPLRIMTTEGNITKKQFENIKNELYKKVYKVD